MEDILRLNLTEATAEIYTMSLSTNKKKAGRLLKQGYRNYLLPYLQAFEQAFHDEGLIRAVGNSMGINIYVDSDYTPIDIFLDKIMSVIELTNSSDGITNLQWIIDMEADEFYLYIEDQGEDVEEYDHNDRLYQMVMNDLL